MNIFKNDEKKIIIKNKISMNIVNSNDEILKNLEVIKDEHAQSGLLSSNSYLIKSTEFITYRITQLCYSLLNDIEETQKDLNADLSVKELTNIKDYMQQSIQNLIDSISGDFKTRNGQIFGGTVNPTFDSTIDSFKNDVASILDSKISEIGLKNKARRDNPEVKQAKRAVWIALFALIISIISPIYSIYKDSNDSKEDLNLIVTRVEDDKSFTYKPFTKHDALVPINYKVDVVNTSNKKVSILKYELFTEQLGYYSNMLAGIYDNDGKVFSFPFSIDAGDTKSIYFKINYLIKQEVNDIIQKEYKYNSSIEYEDLLRHLYKNGVDIFGNKVTAEFYDEKSFSIKWDSDFTNKPVFVLQIGTIKNRYPAFFKCF